MFVNETPQSQLSKLSKLSKYNFRQRTKRNYKEQN